MKSNLKALICVAVLATLGGCASVPMSSPEADSAAKQFQPVPAKSTIYVYRNEVFGAAIKLPVTLDGKMAGQTASKTYFRWDVEPGKHEITSIGEETSALFLNTMANRIYYVWQEVKMGMFAPNSQLHEVDEKTGQAGVTESKRAESDIK